MTRMTRMARTVARMARWLADFADPLFQACLPTRQNGVENRGGVHSKIMHILVQEFVSSRKYIVSYLVFFASFRFLEE